MALSMLVLVALLMMMCLFDAALISSFDMFRRACLSPWWLVLFDNSHACCYFCQRRQVGVLQVLRRLQGQGLANPLLIYHQPISTVRHMLGKTRRRPPRRIGPRAFCIMRPHEDSSYLQAALRHGRPWRTPTCLL